MSLTKKSLALVMALVMAVTLFALPREAEAALASFTVTAYTMVDNYAHVSFTMPTGATRYSILVDGVAQITNKSGSGSIQEEIDCDTAGDHVITVKCDDGGSEESTATKSVTAGTSNITLGSVFSHGLEFVSYTTADNVGGTTTSTTRPIKVFYGETVSITTRFRTGYFSSSVGASMLSGTPTVSGNVITTPAITRPDNVVYIGGGYYLPGEAMTDYTARGTTGTYYGSGPVSYTLNCLPHMLKKVGVDRQTLVEGTHYTVTKLSGNKTQVTMLESFLNTLPLGYNNFMFIFTDGDSTRATLDVTARGSSGGSSGGYYGTTGPGSVTRSVTVYKRASSSGGKLGTLSKDADITVTSFTESGSYAVIQFGAEEGYIKADYVEADVPDAITGRTSSSTYLYTERSTSSKYRYASVSKGTTLELLRREGSYWLVDFGGDELYVRAKYVKNLTVG